MLVKYQNTTAIKYPYSEHELYADNPGVYFPNLSNETLAPFNVANVVVTGAPEHDQATHISEPAGCAYSTERQRWETQFTIRALTAEELAARIPQSVTMRQGRLALLQFGMLSNVDAALAAMPDATQRQAAQIEWEYATEILRDSPLVQQLGGALGLSDAQFDQLFVLAATL